MFACQFPSEIETKRECGWILKAEDSRNKALWIKAHAIGVKLLPISGHKRSCGHLHCINQPPDLGTLFLSSLCLVYQQPKAKSPLYVCFEHNEKAAALPHSSWPFLGDRN